MSLKRNCLICSDEIPATAHRLKKICGEKECKLEQQRRSGRASYHRVRGHGEREKRLCAACSADITDLRTNRVVCLDPKCKKTINKRKQSEWYERNIGIDAYKQKRAVAQAKYRAMNKKPRTCQVCREDITHLASRATICLKQACEDYRNLLRSQRSQPVKPARKTITRPKPTPPKIDVRYQRKPGENQKFQLPKKRVEKPHIIDEGEPWQPRTFNIPTYIPTNSLKSREISVEVFSDPWNCQACRTVELLCRLHKSMTDEGMEPRKETYA